MKRIRSPKKKSGEQAFSHALRAWETRLSGQRPHVVAPTTVGTLTAMIIAGLDPTLQACTCEPNIKPESKIRREAPLAGILRTLRSRQAVPVTC